MRVGYDFQASCNFVKTVNSYVLAQIKCATLQIQLCYVSIRGHAFKYCMQMTPFARPHWNFIEAAQKTHYYFHLLIRTNAAKMKNALTKIFEL